jgi:signal peptidase I
MRQDKISMTVSTEQKRKEGGFSETVRVVFHALIIAVVIRTFLFQPFNIPSGSMKDTLLIGDYLFVSKYSYGYSRYSLPFSLPLFSGRILGSLPKRGDVVVFKWPKDNETDYIKRVIGLPGDKIQMDRGELYINGEKVRRNLVSERNDDEGAGSYRRVKLYTEVLPEGVSHLIEVSDNGYSQVNNTDVIEVPPGCVFMMGDNRDNSSDSRSWGPVPVENLVGRAQIIFFSVQEGEHAFQVWRWPWSVRWGRLFTIVR